MRAHDIVNINARNKVTAKLKNGKIIKGRQAINYLLRQKGAKAIKLDNGQTLQPIKEKG